MSVAPGIRSSPAPGCMLCQGQQSSLLVCKEGFDIVRCVSCGLVYVANPPDEKALETLYSFSSGYHAGRVANDDQLHNEIAEARNNLRYLCRFVRTGSLLDVGCSTGQFLRTARQAAWRCVGIEYSADSARVAREHYGLEVETGTVDRKRIEGRQFDAITLWDVIEHMPDPRRPLQVLRDALNDGGMLFIKTPRADGLFPRISLWTARWLNFWRHPEPPGHLFQFSRATLERLLCETGFTPVAIRNERISIVYSFGAPRDWLRSLRWALYCLLFIPIAWIGPWLCLGDAMTIAARKTPR